MANVEHIQSTGYINNRRSQRVVLRLPIKVQGEFEDGPPCVETSHTLVVNGHGALIVLAMKVHVKQPLVVQNLTTGKEQRCQVVHVSGRQSNMSEIGVAFLEPAPHFWNIDFPPADWKLPLDQPAR